MARIISITSPATRTQGVLEELKTIDALLELQLYSGASLSPAGDVIKVAVPNHTIQQVMEILDRHQLGQQGGLSVSMSDPDGIIPSASGKPI